MGNRACNRQRDGAYFRRGPQPQIDAEDIAMHRQVLQQFKDAPPDANGRLGRFLALFGRQGFPVIQKNRIDIGAVVQLPPAMFAQRHDGKALRRGVRAAFGDRCLHSARTGTVRKVGQRAGDLREIPCARQIGDGHSKRNAASFDPQSFGYIRAGRPLCARQSERGVRIAGTQRRLYFRARLDQSFEERAVGARAVQGIGKIGMAGHGP